MPHKKIQITEIKPIDSIIPKDSIEDDIEDILKSVNKLENNVTEIKELNNEIKNLIAEYLFKPEIPKSIDKRKGWLWN